jgi:pilus assembly protein Flp/PilA
MEPGMRFVRKWLRDERAATLVEYALIAALIAIITVPVMRNFGTRIKNVFATINSGMSV